MKKGKSEKNIDRYTERSRHWIVLFLRLYLGLQQIKYRPYYYLSFIPVFGLFGVIWCNKDRLFTIPFLPPELLAWLNTGVAILLALTLVLFCTALIKFFGISASKWIEHKLIVVFDAKDLKKCGYPILISCKRIKGTNIYAIELYSHIHLDRWKEKKPNLEEILEMEIKSIDYAREDKGCCKVIYAKPKGLPDNIELHDEALDKEIETIG